MKFPGKRKTKHYFPVSEKGRTAFQDGHGEPGDVYVVGIDQLLVDIEARVDESYLSKIGIKKGQSVVFDDQVIDHLYQELKSEGYITGEFAGGTIGNTLHNYSVLADDLSYLIGTISSNIAVNDYAFHYIRNTSSRVSFKHLYPTVGMMGRAICFVTPDGERSFGISLGIMNELPSHRIPDELISKATALVITTYLLRNEKAPIYAATMAAVEAAKKNNVPIILSLGTESLVNEKRDFLKEFIASSINIVAGNFEEVCSLTQQKDPLLAGKDALDLADLVLLTHGRYGIYLCAYVDKEFARPTKDTIHSKAIPEYNRYEYSRALNKGSCNNPIKIYSHINPYLGGPSVIRSTNGAGDAALASLLHDMAANAYHRHVARTSPKHKATFLTYSSIHQISKYANRVSYEVIRRNSPRLVHGLPEREDSLEQSYWEK